VAGQNAPSNLTADKRVFGVMQHQDLATLSESLKEQRQTLRKTISQIGVTKRTFRE
jgi:hypothetical protein